MASTERSGRMAGLVAICLMFLPIHTLPLMAAESAVEKSAVDKSAVTSEESQKTLLVKGGEEPQKTLTSEEPQKKSMAKKLGIASYYAKKYQGRRTTLGERYRPEKMTAAHQSLPLGTRVLVRNLANDKEVTVVINDRCRKKSVPFIDVSRAAAQKLGFFGAGTAKVAIIPLTDDEL